MAVSPRRVSWDACTWIALIQKEKIRDASGTITEDRETLCKAVIRAAEAGKIEIATSTLSLVEVCKNPTIRSTGDDEITAYFEHDYVLVVALDRFVGERARQLMQGRYAGLKPPDAVHLATAAVSNAEELHTYDDDLLALDGVIDKPDGTKLRIRKPDPGSDPMPLFAPPSGPLG
jgi:predicted nucleic acid-binding protein